MTDELRAQKPVVILGMHRSGTSCLTGIVQSAGVELGEVFTNNPFNLKGNRELLAIMKLNDALMERNGGAWDRPMLVSEWDDAQLAAGQEIVRELRSRSSKRIGFKDPRSLFTLPFWNTVIPEQDRIGTLRHPMRVAASLAQRNSRFDLASSLRLWTAYNQRLREEHDRQAFPIVDFDQTEPQYLKDVKAKLTKFSLVPNPGSTFFDNTLRNQLATPIDGELPQPVLELYTDLKARCYVPA